MTRLNKRPFDEVRKLPIPLVNEFPEGHDFTAINGEKTFKVGTQMLCGLCGEPLEGSIAFLGGIRKSDEGVYVDPPMHESCAEESTRLCPHISIPHAKRATDRRLRDDVVESSRSQTIEQSLEKPTTWQMTVVEDYEMGIQDGILFFIPGRVIRLRYWSYTDSGLQEITGVTRTPA